MKLGPTQFENICRQEFRYASNDEFINDGKENIVVQHLSLFPMMFQNASSSGSLKLVIVWWIEDICFFLWKIEIYFIEWTPSVMFSQVVKPRVKILPMVFTRWNYKFRSFIGKKNQIFCLFHAFNPFWEKLYKKIQYSSFLLFPLAYPFRVATQLQYYVKRMKCKLNDVIFPSGC